MVGQVASQHPAGAGSDSQQRPGRRAWDEDRIGAELAELLDELRATGWPTYQQFRRAGRGGLRKAIDRHGGPDLWARIVGLPLDPSTRRPGWDDRRIEHELAAYLRGRPDPRWPLRADFVRDGRGPLLAAIDRDGGLAHWKARVADEVLERRLRAVLTGWPRWPTAAEWQQANALPLLVAMHRHPLGRAGWALRLGHVHHRARRRRSHAAAVERAQPKG